MNTLSTGLARMTVQCIIPKQCRPTIDEIDAALAKLYSFSEEELDFIIKYDIEYRVGDALAACDER